MKCSGCSFALILALSACGDDPSVSSGDAPDSAQETRQDAGTMRDGATTQPPLDAGKKPPLTLPTGSNKDAGNCDNALEITIRDFTEKHPDFEHFTSSLKGIVKDELGPDRKPVYANTGPTAATSGPDQFAQWYNDVPDVNMRLSYRLTFSEKSDGVYVFDSAAFFPIDGMGFGNGPNSNGIDIPIIGPVGGSTAAHNFLFTTEAHTVFSYRGGEKFTFTGDDDMWVFLNNKLAIDLGGTHSQLSGSIDLDAQAAALGLEKGRTYAMDIFHAERHTNESNYHIETTIDLSCIENVPVAF